MCFTQFSAAPMMMVYLTTIGSVRCGHRVPIQHISPLFKKRGVSVLLLGYYLVVGKDLELSEFEDGLIA